MNQFIDMMNIAISSTDGTEAEAFAMFELQLLGQPSSVVWELFEPVRLTILRRLYGMAKFRAEPVVDVRPSAAFGAASESETVDSSGERQEDLSYVKRSAVSGFDRRRTIKPSVRSRSPRGASSAQEVIMSIGGKKSHLDWITNHRGIPIGDLTFYGLANCLDESPLVVRYAQRLMESGIPKSGRQSDIVRRFITPEEADRIWLDLFKEVA